MKKSAVFFLSLTLYTSGLIADSDSQICDLQQRVATLEKSRNTLPPRPYTKNGVGIFLTAEPLYWRATEQGLDYAISGSFDLKSVPSTFYNLDLEDGKTHKPKFDWDWGFRVGAGYDTHHDGWDLYSNWTRYHHSAKDHIHKQGDPNAADFVTTGGSGDYISPFWTAQLFSPPGLMNRAKAQWNLHLDLVDLELGRNFLITKFLSLRPYIGVRSGWIDQNYHLSFLGFNFPSQPSVVGRKISIRMKNDFWGIGGKAGLNSLWFLGKGFSVYGNGAFSLLDGHYHIRYKLHDQTPVSKVTVTGSSSGVGVVDIVTTDTTVPYDDSFENKKHIHTIAPIANLALGLRWEKAFSNEHCFFSIWGGYEQNVFFGQNQFMNFQNDFTLIAVINSTSNPQGSGNGPNYFTDGGNLVLSGFTGGVAFAF